MRRSLRLELTLVLFVAAIIGPSAFASSPRTVNDGFTIACGSGTVTFNGESAMWPPDHKYHPYTVTYDAGQPGDVVAASARSLDGTGIQETDRPTATVADGSTTAYATVGLFAAMPPKGTTVMYAVDYYVSGSNLCGGMVLVTMPTRPPM